MSIFNTNSRLSLTRYKAAGKPTLGNSWFTAVANFIATRFTTETAMNVDTITEATADEGVTIESIRIKDGAITSAVSAVDGFPAWNGVDPSDWVMYIEDFLAVDQTTVSAGADSSLGYNIVSDDVGATGAADGLGGWLNVVTGGTDNNETYLASIPESFIFATDKKLVFKCRITPTEANTNACNWIIGLSDTVGANTLQDDGDGPAASYDGAVFFKVDGDLNLGFETSNAASQTTTAAASTITSGTTVNLAFVYDYNDGTTATVTPYINGTAGTAHSITISGLQEIHILIGVKAGSGNAETLPVDYIAVAQERR